MREYILCIKYRLRQIKLSPMQPCCSTIAVLRELCRFLNYNIIVDITFGNPINDRVNYALFTLSEFMRFGMFMIVQPAQRIHGGQTESNALFMIDFINAIYSPH